MTAWPIQHKDGFGAPRAMTVALAAYLVCLIVPPLVFGVAALCGYAHWLSPRAVVIYAAAIVVSGVVLVECAERVLSKKAGRVSRRGEKCER